MKRNLYLLFALLLTGTLNMSAQQLAVTLNDGGMRQFDENPGICKITFSNGQMLFHVNDAVESTIAIKDIQRMVFYAYHASVDDMETKDNIVYNPVSAELVANVAPGTVIKIYRTCGECVLSRIQTVAAPAINLAHLSAGTYIVVAGSETLKFVKR
jgi:hypothetical protein